MNWITRDILIGNVREAQDAELLRSHGVRAIPGLVDTFAGFMPTDMGVEAMEIVPLLDGH